MEIGPYMDQDRDTRGLEIRVSDTGEGIPADHLEKIWEPFHQVEDAFRRSHAGAGLGLSIVRNIVTAYGGSVELESVLGVGTTVFVKLPNAKQASHLAATD